MKITPEDSCLWFNYGQACLHASRSGKSVAVLERAVKLEGDGDMSDRFTKQLAFCQKLRNLKGHCEALALPSTI